jgi:hypothetical protein
MTQSAASLIDLERYPVDRLDTPEGAALVAACREQLAANGCCNLTGFVRPEAVAAMRQEALELEDMAYRQDGRRNAYFTLDDPALPEDDPRRRYWHYRMHQLAGDVIPRGALSRALFEWDGLTEFFRRILGYERLYRMADEFQNLNLIYLHQGHHQPWHYDQGEFAVTLLLQAPEAGGDFEFVPAIRSETDEHLDDVAAAMDGRHPGIVRPARDAGTLTVFRGMYALHRVSEVGGSRPRITAVLSYDGRPDRIATDRENVHIYGPRVAAVLEARRAAQAPQQRL